MRYFEADYCDSDPFTFYGFLYGFCHSLAKLKQRAKNVLLKVEDVIYFDFGNNQSMSLRQWINIEKRKELIVFSQLVAWDFAFNDPGED